MVEVQVHPEAVAELVGAHRWYAERSERAAEVFAAEFERTIERLREAPLRWPLIQHGTRRVRLRRFPFAVVYQVRDDVVEVLAVAHLHRRPGYWRERRG